MPRASSPGIRTPSTARSARRVPGGLLPQSASLCVPRPGTLWDPPPVYRGVVIAAGDVPSPNIWNAPQVYELENRAADPEGRIEAAMRAVRTWDGAAVLDIGCGTGFHLPFFARTAAKVLGVEPHEDLAAAARRRVADLPGVSVRVGAAQS